MILKNIPVYIKYAKEVKSEWLKKDGSIHRSYAAREDALSVISKELTLGKVDINFLLENTLREVNFIELDFIFNLIYKVEPKFIDEEILRNVLIELIDIHHKSLTECAGFKLNNSYYAYLLEEFMDVAMDYPSELLIEPIHSLLCNKATSPNMMPVIVKSFTVLGEIGGDNVKQAILDIMEKCDSEDVLEYGDEVLSVL